ncbi:MAG: hypothetical protein GY757_19510 [bacterium]|nr:hypothetical protein [bacterium]
MTGSTETPTNGTGAMSDFILTATICTDTFTGCTVTLTKCSDSMTNSTLTPTKPTGSLYINPSVIFFFPITNNE